MSRLHIQNVPEYVTSDRLKEHFSKFGQITDACIIKTKAGKSRRFGFVGYRTEDQAQEALKYFNQSFFDTCRLSVKIAKSKDSGEIDRPWSKYSKGSSRYDKVNEKKEAKELKKKQKHQEEEVDPEFKEFLEVMQPRTQTKFWANDDAMDVPATLKTRGSSVVEESQVDESEPSTVDTPSTAHLSDLEYLKLKKANAKPTEAAPIESEVESVSSNRLFVRNLPNVTLEDDLRELFEGYGELQEVHLPLDDSKRMKGFGFISFKDTQDATAALAALNNQPFQGRILHILPARVKIEAEEAAAVDESTMTYREKKEADRKKKSERQAGWNAAYIRGDATVDSLAAKFGVAKGDILDKESGNMAVRLAIGETMLIKENKEYFAKEGVDLDALQGAQDKSKKNVERSTTTILVKNLPFSTEKEELTQLFGKFGELGRVVLPPSKTLALIEFLEPSEARRAFRSLAYKKYQHVPLYLEWAPTKVLKKKAIEVEAKPVDSTDKTDHDEDEDDLVEQQTTVFIKNLNFSTTEKILSKSFERFGTVRKVTIATKRDASGTKVLSMGYGFVEYSSMKEAQDAIEKLQGVRIEGHALELKLSQKKLVPTKKRAQVKGCTKITVRNVAFEATVKDIRQLFASFGQLKRVRLPKKFDGSHRGFAFVEFLTEQEARNAFSALSSTHLYGRHLVLEWARDDQSLQAVRDKATRDVNALQATKRRRSNSHDDFVEDQF